MAIKVAYGSKEGILNAFSTGGIPTGSFAVTRDSSELYFYGSDSNLLHIAKKNQFNSMEEANSWIQKYNCVGQLISVHVEEAWGAYIVDDENNLNLIAGEPIVQTYKTHLEFPTIGVNNILYLATDENEGRGYIYHWSEDRGSYEIPADTLAEDSIEVIHGGGA